MYLLKSPKEITKLLRSNNPKEVELGYQSFLGRTHWLKGYTCEDLKKVVCVQLGMISSNIIANPPKYINPNALWASQETLEAEKIDMVDAAHDYFQKIDKHFPPIVVWNFFDSQRIRYVVHDGHHRAYFYHKLNRKIKAVILEPIGDYATAEEKLSLAFKLRLRVIDLPII